jgi:hypothetical protein
MEPLGAGMPREIFADKRGPCTSRLVESLRRHYFFGSGAPMMMKLRPLYFSVLSTMCLVASVVVNAPEGSEIAGRLCIPVELSDA